MVLALLPTYAGLAQGLDWQLTRLASPLYTYLFRNAVTNTTLLLVAVYLLSLGIGWTWAITGVHLAARPLLLLPVFIPGALVGLLWRPLFAGWLDLAQAEISLAVTALVLLWRAVPLAAWFFSKDRHGWAKFIPLCALLVLLDGDLVLILTRGEPFNASHTWSSWLVQQLWVNRAWGYAASMAGALALLIAILTGWASWRTPFPVATPYGSPLGLWAALLWTIAPFMMPLWAFVQAPRAALATLLDLGALLWLLNGALLWGGATLVAKRFAWTLPTARARMFARVLTLAMLPAATVALAYLVNGLPFLGNRWLLILITGLLTAGLLMSDELSALRRPLWARAAGYSALVIAFTFPLQLVMQLPPTAWTPTLGIIWALAEAPHATAAGGLALLLYGMWGALAARLVTREQKRDESSFQPLPSP